MPKKIDPQNYDATFEGEDLNGKDDARWHELMAKYFPQPEPPAKPHGNKSALPGHEFYGNQYTGGAGSTDLHSIADVSLPADTATHDFYYHAPRYDDELEAITQGGIVPGNPGGKVYLSKDEIRDRGAGVAIVRVPKGTAVEGTDFVETGLTYREFTVDKVPASDVVRVVRNVTDSTGFKIREDELAKAALSGQGSPAEIAQLPEKYQAWFKK